MSNLQTFLRHILSFNLFLYMMISLKIGRTDKKGSFGAWVYHLISSVSFAFFLMMLCLMGTDFIVCIIIFALFSLIRKPFVVCYLNESQ